MKDILAIAKYLLVYVILFSGGNSYAQEQARNKPEACKQHIQEAYKRLKAFSVPEKDQGMYLSYTVNSVFGSVEAPETAAEHVKVYLKGGRSFLSSNAMDVYLDKEAQVSILKQKKAIYISAPGNADQKKMQWENNIMLQDTMLAKATVKKCVPASNGLQEIILLPSMKFQQATGVRQIVYLLDEGKKEIKKITMTYAENQPIIQVSFEINALDLDYAGNAYSGKAVGKVLSSSGKLLSPYSTYQLVDLRKQH